MTTSYLLLHGLGGSGPEHWQSWLSAALTARGERVYFPQFPEQDHPSLDTWLNELNERMAAIPLSEELVVYTHSLGCILWFHYAAQSTIRRVKQVVLVCPPAATTKIAEIKAFFPPPQPEHLKASAEQVLIIQSSNDEFCALQDTLFYQNLDVPHLTLPNMGHINTASGHGPWPLILKHALSGNLSIAEDMPEVQTTRLQ